MSPPHKHSSEVLLDTLYIFILIPMKAGFDCIVLNKAHIASNSILISQLVT